MPPRPEPWYAVRCVFALPYGAEGTTTYEERITLWSASSLDEAIEHAEREAGQYAASSGGRYVNFAQAFHLAVEDPIQGGAEVFSLMRESELEPGAYLDRFLDDGRERQQQAEG